MSIDQNVIEHNILGHMFLENVKDFSAMAVPISAVETRLENVETGEIYGCNCHCIGFDGRTILYHRGGNMAFAAPSALTDSVANVAIEVPYGGSSTKFLKVKNLNQEQQMKDETQ
jgi:hypothetical protein